MKLDQKVSQALDEWLNPETWYTGHPLDMSRFYNFIDQYSKQHGYSINENALLEEICQRRNISNEDLKNTVQGRISLALNILEFLDQTGR